MTYLRWCSCRCQPEGVEAVRWEQERERETANMSWLKPQTPKKVKSVFLLLKRWWLRTRWGRAWVVRHLGDTVSLSAPRPTPSPSPWSSPGLKLLKGPLSGLLMLHDLGWTYTYSLVLLKDIRRVGLCQMIWDEYLAQWILLPSPGACRGVQRDCFQLYWQKWGELHLFL